MVHDEQIKQMIEDDGGVERSYQMALMVTFSPGVRSWGTNSQWQLLLSSAMSSPGRLASKARREIKKDLVEKTFQPKRHKGHVKEEAHDHNHQSKLINQFQIRTILSQPIILPSIIK